MTTWTRKQIANAKFGTHTIPLEPGKQPQRFVVVRVRGDRVQVQRSDAVSEPFWLPVTAGHAVMKGEHRNTTTKTES